ncbi:deoxyribonuclease IV [Caulifigura coniformis]|nr:deoxyribonuclease IV [Caulifigura coniformis]
MSIAGGLHKAVEAAARLGMDTVQVFTKSPSQWGLTPIAPGVGTGVQSGVSGTKNNNQWRGKPLVEHDIRLFREALDRTGLQHPCAHNSYLINVGSADQTLWQKSVDALVDEVERAEAFGLDGIVMHPGAAVGATEEEALARIVLGIDETHRRTPEARAELWLEATAGQGSCLGCRFEHLAFIIDNVEQPERLGVCIDTCHIFAAGYPIGTPDEFNATFRQLDDLVGLDRVRAFHVNDSKKPLGSRVDRHDHIGEGCLGLEPFRLLLNDERFARLPMYLETKKEQRDGEEMDAVNLRTLRALMAGAPSANRPSGQTKVQAKPSEGGVPAEPPPARKPATRARSRRP